MIGLIRDGNQIISWSESNMDQTELKASVNNCRNSE